MANQVIVTNTGNVQVALTPPPNVQVQISRAAIGTVSNVPTANYANFANYSSYAGNVTTANQPNITSLGTLTGLNVSGNGTIGNLTVSGNLLVGNLFANNANYANFANIANIANVANSVAVANVVGLGNIATINLDGSASNVLYGNGTFAPGGSGSNANYANFAGSVVNASQPNITSVGNLVDLRINNANIHLGTNAGLTTQSANSVAIGTNAGQTNQGNGITNARAVAIGFNTANLNQGDSAVAVGRGSGQNTQGNSAVAIGWSAAGNNQSANAIAIGTVAGNTLQGLNSIAIGMSSGRISQGSNSVAIGMNAGYNNQANNSIILNATGANLDFTTANSFVVKPVRNILTGNAMFYDTTTGEISYDALGNVNVGNANYANIAGTAYSVSGSNVVGMVSDANIAQYVNVAIANTSVTSYRLAMVDWLTGNHRIEVESFDLAYNANTHTLNSINFSANGNISGGNISGNGAGLTNINGANVSNVANANYASYAANVTLGSQPNITAVGNLVDLRVENNSIHLGANAGVTTQSANSVAIGTNAGLTNQGNGITNARAVAIGFNTANLNQGDSAVAIGRGSGQNTQGNSAVAIGWSAAGNQQSANAIAIGTVAGNTTQGIQSIAIGQSAGRINQGANSIALGANAGYTNQANNSIILNATGANLDFTTANSFVVKPVRQANTANIMYYNNTTGELSYDVIPTSSIIANGTSNVSIPVANGVITFSANGNANIANLDGNGTLFLLPKAGGFNNALRIDNYGTSNPATASRLASFRYRGNSSAQLSVQPNDTTIDILTLGHNGSGLATSSVAKITAQVDSSYTANTANIPIGWNIQVNDTNGGTNNQSKVHQFYSNGTVSFANSISTTGALSAGNTVSININNSTTQGLFQTVYNNANLQTAQWTSWRFRGTSSSPAPVQAGDEISKFASIAYGDSGNSYVPVFQQITNVSENDLAGNVSGAYQVVGFGANSVTQFYAKEHQFGNIGFSTNATIYGNGTANVANLSIQTNGFVKLANYTAAALTAITGQIGWMAAVSDSAQGSNPNGMLAYWDTTNGRWSYVHDNSAV